MAALNKLQFTIFSVCTFLLLSQISFATEDISLTLSANDIMIYSGESKPVDVTIQNNQNYGDRFSINIFYLQAPGITIVPEKYSIDVGANSNSTFRIYLYASECVEEMRTLVTITLKSLTHENVQDSKVISLNTIRNFTVCIYESKLDKYVINPGETIKISTKLKNPTGVYSMPIILETKIMKEGKTIEKFEDRIETVPSNSLQQTDHYYTFDKYSAAGFYSVEVTLKDTSGVFLEKKKIDFRIAQLPEKVVKEETVTWGLFTQTVTIKVRNDGNVNSSGFYLTATIPIFMKPFFFPKVRPTSEDRVENTIIYSWYIEGLAPAEEREIKYEVSTSNSLLIALAIIGFAIYSFNYVFRISIVKKHKYVGPLTKEKEITISLEVRNRTKHEIKDILIRDFVPSIATVVEKFDTLRPTLRKVAGGTELIWRLDYLKPLEERVLTYKVRPSIDIIGTLKLPKALMRYSDKDKKIKKIISKSIKIKAR
jgi:hypothetical protein